MRVALPGFLFLFLLSCSHPSSPTAEDRWIELEAQMLNPGYGLTWAGVRIPSFVGTDYDLLERMRRSVAGESLPTSSRGQFLAGSEVGFFVPLGGSGSGADPLRASTVRVEFNPSRRAFRATTILKEVVDNDGVVGTADYAYIGFVTLLGRFWDGHYTLESREVVEVYQLPMDDKPLSRKDRPVVTESFSIVPSMPTADAFGDPVPPGAVARLRTTERLAFKTSDYARGICGLAISSNGDRVSFATNDGWVRIRETSSGRSLGEFRCEDVDPVPLAFSRDDDMVSGPGRGRQTFIWDIKAQERTYAAAFIPSPSSGVLITDSGVLREGKKVVFEDSDLLDPTKTVISADGSTVASMRGESKAVVWDATSGKRKMTAALSDQGDDWSALPALSPDGSILASGWRNDGRIQLWDTGTGRQLESLHGHFGSVWILAFSADGKRLASAGADSTVLVWDVPKLGTK